MNNLTKFQKPEHLRFKRVIYICVLCYRVIYKYKHFINLEIFNKLRTTLITKIKLNLIYYYKTHFQINLTRVLDRGVKMFKIVLVLLNLLVTIIKYAL